MLEAHKKCFKCGETKPLSEFYAHAQMADGHVNKCKPCNRKDVKENREKREAFYQAYDRIRAREPHRKEAKKVYQQGDAYKTSHAAALKRSRVKEPEKYKARTAVGNALRDGRLTKAPCAVCGDEDVQGHHEDYSRKLDVVWLCVAHHAELHRQHDEQLDEDLLTSTERGSRWR